MSNPSWTIIRDQEMYDRACALAKGCYQQNLLDGRENLSGSSLRGKAREYGARYRESRQNLLERMSVHGVAWSEQIGQHNARILVIGQSKGESK